MTGLKIDLPDFSSIDQRLYGNLLIGNGFSIGVNSNFTYRSLYSAGVTLGSIDTATQDLFQAFDTNDFEYLLRKLFQASIVNRVLNIDHITPETKYKLVRDSLIKSVNSVHPNFSDIDYAWLQNCSKFMQRMANIFSLNYDLFPYWIAGSDNFDGYTDFFWSSGLSFDQFNTDVWGRKTKMYYPHGALFIFEGLGGEISKIRQVEGENILHKIGQHIDGFNIPIFVSEGTHAAKLNKIRQNQYLSFAYQKISNMTGGLMIYGTSLSVQDSHIVDAIKRSRVGRIAFGVWPGSKSAFDVEGEKQDILRKFQDSRASIEFFDSSTCPLSYNP